MELFRLKFLEAGVAAAATFELCGADGHPIPEDYFQQTKIAAKMKMKFS